MKNYMEKGKKYKMDNGGDKMKIKIEVEIPEKKYCEKNGTVLCSFLSPSVFVFHPVAFCKIFGKVIRVNKNNTKPCPECMKAREEAKK